MTRFKLTRPNIKPLAERNRLAVGATGTLLIIALVVAAFSYDKIPFIKGTSDYTAYFADAGGIKTGSDVRVSGLGVGRVSSIHLEGTKVRVDFTVRDGVDLGDRTEASIKTETVLGTKVLELTPRGDGNLNGPIPIERTTSPYDLPTALGDLTTTISGLDTTQLSSALTTLAQTFQNTPPELKLALEGVARFSDTLGTRDAKLRELLSDANSVTAVLAKRSDQIARLVVNSDALLAEILAQRNSVDTLMTNLSAAAQQLSGLVQDNRTQLKPALDKLNGVLGILDNRKKELQRTVYLFRRYAMSFGEVLGAGPFFKASLVNLFPGQFVQPFTDAAFSDLGLDPNVKLPSQLVEPGVGQPGTPPLPVPYPRTGQGGPPKQYLPDAITGNPGDPGCGPPGVPLPGPTGCYPYREPLAAPAPGGPPPGPPALAPAPGELPTPTVAPPNGLPPVVVPPNGAPGVISDPVSPVGGQ
ncbi:MAG: MCE family protein [Mycobacterium sp.]|nr:MCE family protein [Mycobacterium sp.]